MATLKNTTVSDTGAIQLPVGTTAQRPGSPSVGQMRYNSTFKTVESYDGTSWKYTPDIIRNNLVLYLDAGEPSSYSGSGTSWNDLSGNGNNMTLTGSPTFSSSNGGVLQFNGSTQYGSLTSLNYSTATYTIVAAARYSGATRGRVITSVSNNWLFGHWSGTTENFYAEGWVTAVGGGVNDTNWRIYAATENYSLDERSFYVNATITSGAGKSSSGSQGFNGLSIGRWAFNNTEYSTCEVSFILVYNKILSDREIKQNYEAMRGRFGL